MHDNFSVEPEVLKAKLIGETALIAWHDLQKFYATGAVLTVAASVDLIDVAYAIATDDKNQVAALLGGGQLERTTEQQALSWYQQNTELWAVVVSPWVLVQQRDQLATKPH